MSPVERLTDLNIRETKVQNTSETKVTAQEILVCFQNKNRYPG